MTRQQELKALGANVTARLARCGFQVRETLVCGTFLHITLATPAEATRLVGFMQKSGAYRSVDLGMDPHRVVAHA